MQHSSRLADYTNKQTNMPLPYLYQSPRIGFRKWTKEDEPIFHKMCNDPVVMEYLPAFWSMGKVQTRLALINQEIDEYGHGFFAVDELATGKFMGFIGIKYEKKLPPWSPMIEIGWRLDTPFWGKGYATEGAKATLKFGFETIGIDTIYAIAPQVNRKSIRIMEKTGMKYLQKFQHPLLSAESKLKTCELWKIERKEFNQKA